MIRNETRNRNTRGWFHIFMIFNIYL